MPDPGKTAPPAPSTDDLAERLRRLEGSVVAWTDIQREMVAAIRALHEGYTSNIDKLVAVVDRLNEQTNSTLRLLLTSYREHSLKLLAGDRENCLKILDALQGHTELIRKNTEVMKQALTEVRGLAHDVGADLVPPAGPLGHV